MNSNQGIAVFIDLANAWCVDFPELLRQVAEMGDLEDVRAYGDFSQRHLGPLALELYALGVSMHHCPSWSNGAGHGNGPPARKRTDDRLLQEGVRELLRLRPSVGSYILVTADADIIPTCHSIRKQGRDVQVMCPTAGAAVGRVLAQSGLEILAAPMIDSCQPSDSSCAGPYSDEELIGLLREIDSLEQTSEFLTFTYLVNNIAVADVARTGVLMGRLNRLLEIGALSRYPYCRPKTGQTLPAIRVNRSHLLVASALDGANRSHPEGSA